MSVVDSTGMPMVSHRLDIFLKITVIVTLFKVWPITFLLMQGEWLACLVGVLCVGSGVCYLTRYYEYPSLLICGLSYVALYSQIPFYVLHDNLINHHGKLLFISWLLIDFYLLFLKKLLFLLEKNLKFLIVYIYVCAILIKLNLPFLSGFRLQQIMAFTYFDSTAFSTAFAHNVFMAISVLTVFAEILIVVLLLSRKDFLRRCGVVLCVVFHALLHLALPVDTFSLQMIPFSLLFW